MKTGCTCLTCRERPEVLTYSVVYLYDEDENICGFDFGSPKPEESAEENSASR